jgi:hypothetical protein
LFSVLVCVAFAVLAVLPASGAPPEPPAVDAADRQAIVDGVIEGMTEIYVFPDVAERMAEHLRGRLADGAYDELDEMIAFTDALTEDLQSISHDKHLRVRWDPADPGGARPSDEERQARFAERLRRDNYCFHELRRLDGNVGYLRLDCFASVETGRAGATAVAAMSFLAGSDGLIIDLRGNGGGSPSMIQLLSSYLFDEPTHLNSFYIRKSDETRQFWTQGHVQGPRMTDVPVWVLTSGRTFSAAEEFTYNLKHLERATIVGETTGGGAHPVETYPIEGRQAMLIVPFGRAVNPVTGTNWEGAGVAPHREVPADAALAAAHAEALETLAADEEDADRRARLEFLAESLTLRGEPVELSTEALRDYVGTYGPRVIALEGGVLRYSRDGGPERVLTPVGDDRFLLGEENDFRLRFERDGDGRVVRIVGLYADGREEPHERAD